MATFDVLGAERIEDVAALCGQSLEDAPSQSELADSLFSEEQEVVVRGQRGVGIVASACVGQQGYVRLLGVVPEQRRRGHGSCLLHDAETDLAARGATSVQVGADPPFYLYPGVESTRTAMLCLLERHHYERTGANFNMDLDLDDLPDDPGGHEVATADMADEIAAWMRVHWANWEAEVLRALQRSTLLVSRDHEGISAFCAYDVNRVGLLGPVAVRGNLWGKGRGRPLLVGALHRMRAAGHRRIEVSWVGPVRPYAAVGGRVGRVFFVYRRALSPP